MVVGSVLFILSLTNLLLVAGNTLALRWRPEAIYRRQGEVQALDWLAQRAEPDDVALSAYETGNYLPVRVHARVFVGHGPETVDYGEKRRLMHRFFDPATDHAWRQRLLREYSVDYVFWGPAERREGAFDPQTASYLHPIYESEPYVIFEVCP